jgi:hypothetical protein
VAIRAIFPRQRRNEEPATSVVVPAISDVRARMKAAFCHVTPLPLWLIVRLQGCAVTTDNYDLPRIRRMDTRNLTKMQSAGSVREESLRPSSIVIPLRRNVS